MTFITDVCRTILRPLSYLSLSVILTASPVLGDPLGPASVPGAGVPGGAAALPTRIGGPMGYFSPVLGARFEIVDVQIAGVGLIKGARLVEDPIAGSPLAGKGLGKDDTITHLDGASVFHTGELELHVNNTKVGWVPKQTQVTRSLNISIQRGKRFADPTGPGTNVGIVGPPINLGAHIAGQWNCSCGGLWTLAQQGNAVTGNETDSQSTNSVSGTFNGSTFSFTYFQSNGSSGTGTFSPNSNLTSMTGTIRWQNGTSSNPTLTRVGAGLGPRPIPNPGIGTQYTVVGLRNDSNQFINCEIRWNGGAWRNVQLQPRQAWRYWTQGHRQRPQLRINVDRTGGQNIQVMNLSGASLTLPGKPTMRDANVYRFSVFGGQIAISQ